jgi:hypothetical protein
MKRRHFITHRRAGVFRQVRARARARVMGFYSGAIVPAAGAALPAIRERPASVRGPVERPP